ncbi:foldase protein PrsA [Pseudobutyrivibrio sp. NOR37]|uniref:PpiC domain-containing protein n=1 Tax=Pseudobutyrivibrio xylanivorans TaxID=185007 RepID=A0A6M0LI32_PSEXY|nr:MULTISPECIES: peptidyl-prolyl cis-trans isomerase [Pseudobutyrivibrio]NEX02142.1 hypothetical protein [Pseudobutyrivibrio xylanivorans]SFR76348.1 foldase protein PrsA [Pseudobutyrivibrio sp. NOR37]
MKKAVLKTTCVAALAGTVLLTGCGNKIKDSATLITIKGENTKETITLGYGNFVARYQQSLYEQFYPMMGYDVSTMWSQDMMGGLGYSMEDQTKSGIITDIEQMYVVKQHAADYGITLSDEQNKAIADATAKFMSDNSKDTLEELGATEEYVKRYLEEKTIYKLVETAVEDAEDANITEDDCWMRTFSYVQIDTSGTDPTTGTVKEYTDEELAAFKDQADSIAAASDFDAEVEAQELTSSTYSYLKGEESDEKMDMAIISAAEELEEGDTSDVIEVEGVGYYVIHLTSDHDEDASADKKSSLKTDAFNSLVDTWMSAYEFTLDDDQWAKVTFTDHFKSKPVEQPEETEAPADDAEATDESTESTEVTEDEDSAEETETTEDTAADSEETPEESTDETAE